MRKITCLLFTATLLLFSSGAFSQSIYLFIKALDNNGVMLNGGSIQPGHTNQIDGLSYSQGVANACDTCPQGSDFTFMMSLNPATVGMRQMLLKGLHLQSLDVTYQKPGTSGTIDFYKMHMEDVRITSVQESGSSEVPSV